MSCVWCVTTRCLWRLYLAWSEHVWTTCIWSNYSDLTRPHPEWWFSKRNPLISGKSRLVKCYSLATCISEMYARCFLSDIDIYVYNIVHLHYHSAHSDVQMYLKFSFKTVKLKCMNLSATDDPWNPKVLYFFHPIPFVSRLEFSTYRQL